jgi:DNA polymerase (family 10)
LLYSIPNITTTFVEWTINQIADSFSLLAKLSDIHGENSFKAKSYATAAFTIEKLPVQLSETPHEKIFSIKGIG